MLLDRIDIDNHGPLTHVELGPFSEFLNVVCAPEGSGKTAIARFIRDSLIRREYPLGMMSSSAGRVVWADRNGKIHCRREHDGTAAGRRTIEFESRGDTAHRFDWLHGSWIDGIADSTDASRALESIRIPESIVDGIVTDTAVTSVSRVIIACLKSGLCDPALFAGLPRNRSGVSGLSPDESAEKATLRRSLRDELARIEAELGSIDQTHSPSAGQQAVAAKRHHLRARLAELQSLQSQSYNQGHTVSDLFSPLRSRHHDAATVTSIQSELTSLHDRLWQLRVRHSELTRWLSHLQSDRNRVRYTAPITASPYARSAPPDLALGLLRPAAHAPEIDAELRRHLIDVDAQITRWRRVITELSGLREIIAGSAGRFEANSLLRHHGEWPMSDAVLRHQRMKHFLSSLDRYAGQSPTGAAWDRFTSQPNATRWPDEIDLRIEAIIRQVDMLAAHYDRSSEWRNWYRELPSNYNHRSHESLVHSLQAIREDLHNVRRQGFRFASLTPAAVATVRPMHPLTLNSPAIHREHELYDLRQSEHWAAATVERLLAYRESLVRDQQLAERLRYPDWMHESYQRQTWSTWYIDHLENEAVARTRELDQLTAELDRGLERAGELHAQMQVMPGTDRYGTSSTQLRAEIDALLEELRLMDQTQPFSSYDSPRVSWLKNRRAELIEQLGVPQAAARSAEPLADEASQWLVRLSGGRLRRIDWNSSDFTTAPQQVALAHQAGFAQVDGCSEAACSALDRALATLAVRMAAADLLARTGRAVPIVIEAHRELLRSNLPSERAAMIDQSIPSDPWGWGHTGHTAVNPSVIAALDDFAKQGRQVIVLASDPIFAEQIQRRGGHVFQIVGQRVSHEHRPLWRPHFSGETYVGPYAGSHLQPTAVDPLPQTDAYVDRYHDQYFGNSPIGSSLADINRNLDTVWQEAYGISSTNAALPYGMPAYGMAPSGMPAYGMAPPLAYPSTPAMPPLMPPARSAGLHSGPWSETGPYSETGPWHDGYYYADAYTTAPPSRLQSPSAESLASHSSAESGDARQAVARPSSPFFLSVDSPIDQAPSVDAVAASRLRGLNVTHINHLMNQDPNRLADSLGLAGVTAATIRRWQSECRLVCHVPQLRGFDARVLVGCGIRDAGLLSSTDPMDLLDRVEAFLATERGQRILLSGTSYELSRITSWIAAANVNTDDAPLGRVKDHQTVDGRVLRTRDGKPSDRAIDHDSYDYEFVDDNGQVVRARSNRQRSRRSSGDRENRQRRASLRTHASEGSAGSRAADSDSQSHGNGGQKHSSGNPSVSNGSGRNSNHHSVGRRASASRSESGHEAGDLESRGVRRVRSNEPSTHSVSRANVHSNAHVASNSNSHDGSQRARRSVRSQHNTSESRSASRQSSTSPSNDATETQTLRFYLARESAIVDAPSIGARMAEKLEAIGIATVDDLIQADAAELAAQLDHRRIDADVITAWQNQAILVCRIPMLRGHDAQLLVAAGVTTPEAVADYQPDELLDLINPVARSNEGKRILRGSQLPDLDEIQSWIHYAAQCRELVDA